MKHAWLSCALATITLSSQPLHAQCQREGKFTTADINDKYGRGLSVGRDFVAASAPNDSSLSNQEGKLFIYGDVAGTWVLTDTIQPAGLNPVDLFGFSVAAGAGRVAASALFDDTAGVDSGAVYMFRRDPAPTGWVLEQKLTNPVPGAQLNYGRAIAMGGDVLAVAKWGPPAEVHVYRRSGTVWSLEATLTPSFVDQRYGTDVAVNGDVIAVGDPEYGIKEGAVEIYRFTPGIGWASEHVAMGSVGSTFGESVDVFGARVVVGASEMTAGGTGHVHSFLFNSGTSTWALEQVLIGSDTVNNDGFGTCVSISNSGIYGSSPFQDTHGTNAGAVYGFTFNGTVWSQASKISPNVLIAADAFGTTMDVTGSTLATGNRYQVAMPPDPKAVYVFTSCP
jgi:hypothetical protein